MKCTCTFAQKMVGDGCQYCQPETYKKMLDQQRRDAERDLQNKDANSLARVDPGDDRFTLGAEGFGI